MYFEFRGRAGKSPRPHLVTFMEKVTKTTEPLIRMSRLLSLREAGFARARWELKDSQEVWLAWLDCLEEGLKEYEAEPRDPSGEAGADNLPQQPVEALRTAIDRGRCADLHDGDLEPALRLDKDLVCLRTMQVTILTRQVWMVQKRRLAQLQASLAALLARQTSHRTGMKATSSAATRAKQGDGGSEAADPAGGEGGSDEPTQESVLNLSMPQLLDTIKALDGQPPTGLSEMRKAQRREYLLEAYGIDVPEAVRQAAEQNRRDALERRAGRARAKAASGAGSSEPPAAAPAAPT